MSSAVAPVSCVVTAQCIAASLVIWHLQGKALKTGLFLEAAIRLRADLRGGARLCASGTRAQHLRLHQRAGTPVAVTKGGKARLFAQGHPLVFNGALDRIVGRPQPRSGDPIVLADGAERVLGWGVYNSVSMYRVRCAPVAQPPASPINNWKCPCSLQLEVPLHHQLWPAVRSAWRGGRWHVLVCVYPVRFAGCVALARALQAPRGPKLPAEHASLATRRCAAQA